jgi:hypothetical protein
VKAGHQAASVPYRDVTKRYPSQTEPAINHLTLDDPFSGEAVFSQRTGVVPPVLWLYCRASKAKFHRIDPVGTEDPKGFTPQGRIATNWFVAPLSARARQLTP